MAKIDIVHWNIRSIITNRDSLINIIRDTKPEIISLNETFLKSTQNFSIKQFNVIRQDRFDGRGGIAFLIKKNIPFRLINMGNLNLPDRFQFLILEIESMIIVNIYNPPDQLLSSRVLRDIINRVSFKRFLLIGDFNAQHDLWGSGSVNRNGTIVADLISEFNLVCLNKGDATRIGLPTQNKSVPDLALATPQIAGRYDWEALVDHVGMSDHIPIMCKKINNNMNEHDHENFNLTYNTKKADWDEFRRFLNEEVVNPPNSYHTIQDNIIQAAEASIPRTKKSNKIGNPWWDPECEEAVKRKRAALKYYFQHPNIQNYVDFRKTRANTRKTLRSKKKESFHTFCENLNPRTPSTKVWKSVKRFSFSLTPVINHWPLGISIPQEMLNLLTSPVVPEELIFDNFNLEKSPLFTYGEMWSTIKGKKDSTPGKDLITYSMFQHLPLGWLNGILHMYNEILLGHSRIPPEWKTAVVSVIQKPNKDPSLVTSYRPISMTSCVGKVLESMIKNRIEWLVENHKSISPLQTGFRRGKGIYDNLAILVSEVGNALASGRTTLVVFLDLTGAYDNVNIKILFSKLSALGLPRDLCDIILQFNEDRIVYVKDPIESALVGPGIVNRGVAQGSPLSPLLFNIYVDSIQSIIPEGTIALQYADDLTLAISGSDVADMTRSMNNVLESLQQWATEHRVSFSASKSSAVLFSSRSTPYPHDNLILNDEIIPWSNSQRYLGVVLDSKFTWKLQVDNMRQRADKALNILRFLAGTWWGAHPLTLLTFCKAYVRSHLDFGSIVLSKCAKIHLDKLDRVQFHALRVCLGLMRSTPTNVLLSEAGEMSLELRRNYLAAKFLLKASAILNNPVVNFINSMYINYNHNIAFWSRFTTPPLVEAVDWLRPFINHIDISPTLPYFQLEPVYDETPFIRMKLEKNQDNSNKFFLEARTLFPHQEYLYTDASKEDNLTVGVGVHGSGNTNLSMRISRFMSICSAEVYAIGKAVEIIELSNITEAVIFTDSLSALERLSNCTSPSDSRLTLTIKRKIKNLCNNGYNLHLAWVPSHSKIRGNDRADALANEGRENATAVEMKVDFKEILPCLKKQFWEQWENRWKQMSRTKGVLYKGVVETPYKKPWFHNFKHLNRKQITTFCRIRSGHSIHPSHLNRIGVRPDPHCECGEIGSLNHIFFDCPMNLLATNTLYYSLQKHFNNSSPLNISCIMVASPHIVDGVMEFLSACNLKL